jgi:Mg2+ and Co2+ transporter CorA
MHFNVQSNRNNDVMKTLTALTAIFLPLNLITGFFGMNFEQFGFLKSEHGLAMTEGFMVLLALALVAYFWLNNYLGSAASSKADDR